MTTYLHLAAAGFRRQTQYRLAMFAGLFTNVVFGFIRSAILLAAVASSGGYLAGYDAGSLSAYVWVSQGLLGAVVLGMGTSELRDRIRTGDIAVDLARPVDVQLGYTAADLGRAVYTFIPRGLPSVLVGALTVGLVLPTTPLPYLLGLVSIVLAVALSFLTRFLVVDLPGFWLTETRGLTSTYSVIATFLAGLYVPVHMFPDWLATLAAWTPFPSMLQVPVDVVTGRVTGAASFAEVGVQAAWTLGILLAGRVVMSAATRRLVVQGG